MLPPLSPACLPYSGRGGWIAGEVGGESPADGLPYSECPKCGNASHLLICDVQALADWKLKHTAELARDELPKYLCFKCWETAGKPENWLPPLKVEP